MVILEKKVVIEEDFWDYLNSSEIYWKYVYFLGQRVYADSCSVYGMQTKVYAHKPAP